MEIPKEQIATFMEHRLYQFCRYAHVTNEHQHSDNGEDNVDADVAVSDVDIVAVDVAVNDVDIASGDADDDDNTSIEVAFNSKSDEEEGEPVAVLPPVAFKDFQFQFEEHHCPICFEEFNSAIPLADTKCGHAFHHPLH